MHFTTMLIFVLCSLVMYANAATGAKNQAVLNLFHHDFRGDGTYYGKGLGGTCQYGQHYPPAALDSKINALVAINRPQFMNSLTCGLCLRVVGSGNGLGANPIKGDYIVFVKDYCPECHEGDVDFALNGDGRWDINIQAVQCPVGNTKIQYAFQGSNLYYLKLQIRNARIPITNVELQKDGHWITATHSADGYWLITGSGPWPSNNINIRLTAANGEVLNDVIPKIANDVVMTGGKHVQVAHDPTLPSV